MEEQENQEQMLTYQCPKCGDNTEWLIDRLQAGVPEQVKVDDRGILSVTKVTPPHKPISGYDIPGAVVGTDICLTCGQERTKCVICILTNTTTLVLSWPQVKQISVPKFRGNDTTLGCGIC